MARQLLVLLQGLGYDVRLVSRLRSRLHGPQDLTDLRAAAHREIASLREEFELWQPELWFTYHLYYRAPDLLGPVLSASLAIPYVAAEASHAAKRAQGEWAEAHALASDAIARADLLIALTERDAEGLEAFGKRRGRLLRLKPFLADAGPDPEPRDVKRGPVQLVTVAMMREGGKLASYVVLAEALWPLRHLSWTLGIVGDGAARPAVMAAFARFGPDRIIWHGQLDHDQSTQVLAAADLFVWPGLNEPYGMVYLEAAACGLASVAMASGGVRDVVRHEETGLLAAHGDVEGLSAAIARLIDDHAMRSKLGEAARLMVATERSGAVAAQTIAAALSGLEAVDGR